MAFALTSEKVWNEVEKQLFAVIGTVNANGQPRTSGIVYKIKNGRFYILTGIESVKAKNVLKNPFASLTITIAKRIPFMPWIKIPAATITVHGRTKSYTHSEADPEMITALTKGLTMSEEQMERLFLIDVIPERDFITYGVGIPLMKMADTDAARGRAPVS